MSGKEASKNIVQCLAELSFRVTLVLCFYLFISKEWVGVGWRSWEVGEGSRQAGWFSLYLTENFDFFLHLEINQRVKLTAGSRVASSRSETP